MGCMGRVLKWVALVILEEIPGWCVRQYRGWRIFFSSSFLKLAGNEYCSKLKKEFRFQVICTPNISYSLEFSLDI